MSGEAERGGAMGGLLIGVIGGGSTYTPELVEGLIAGAETMPVKRLTLMDIDAERLRVVGGLAERMVRAAGAEMDVRLTTERREALVGADFVVTQIRVGGVAARIEDERIPLRFSIVGQETTGPGGFAKALRTVPVMVEIAEEMAAAAPGARLINFTNPAGLVTEALLKHGAVPVVGLCNSPLGFVRGIAAELGVEPGRVALDYVGLNHLSWIRGVTVDGEDTFERVLAGAIERARAGDSPFAPEVLETLRMVPNYYLRYYYHHDRVVAEQRAAGKTRGEEVREIEADLLRLYEGPGLVEKPKMLEKRGGAHYSTAAVALIRAIAQDTGEVQIVNTANGGALPGLPAEAVVEMPAAIGREGARALPTRPMGPEIRGLVQAVKAYEELTVEAAMTGDARAAVEALVAHPLVPSFDVARGLWAAILEANRAYLPQFEERR